MAEYPVRLDDLIAYVKDEHPGHGPLEQLSDAVLISSHLDEVADHLIGHFVDQARRSGASWTDIGRSMGVSKQAAQKRFVPRPDADEPGSGLFSRFTIRARRTVENAQERARAARHTRVGSEHLALALHSEPEGLAAQCLDALGITPERLAEAVATPGTEAEPVRGRLRFEDSAKNVLREALAAALALQHNYIGTEHLLLGLVDADADPVAVTLRELGATREAVRAWVTEALAGYTK
jgi:hypothetical protein